MVRAPRRECQTIGLYRGSLAECAGRPGCPSGRGFAIAALLRGHGEVLRKTCAFRAVSSSSVLRTGFVRSPEAKATLGGVPTLTPRSSAEAPPERWRESRAWKRRESARTSVSALVVVLPNLTTGYLVVCTTVARAGASATPRGTGVVTGRDPKTSKRGMGSPLLERMQMTTRRHGAKASATCVSSCDPMVHGCAISRRARDLHLS
jgi:hypothetical protein